jgi:hypothetical protein
MEHESCVWPRRDTSEQQDQFHAEEFRCLRREIESANAEAWRLERYCATACGLVWVWAMGRGGTLSSVAACGIAMVVSTLGFIRSRALYRSIDWVASYVLSLEDVYSAPRLGGWEHHIRYSRSAQKRPAAFREHRAFSTSSLVFWIVLSAASVIMTVAMLIKLGPVARHSF